MKKIIVGLLVCLQMVYGVSEKEMDKLIVDWAHKPAIQGLLKCERAASYYVKTENPALCLNAAKVMENGGDLGPISKKRDEYISESYYNAGLMYDHQGDKLNAYKWYMKSAKLGTINGKNSQHNLNIMCKESPWACK